jgi:hypothetical protein
MTVASRLRRSESHRLFRDCATFSEKNGFELTERSSRQAERKRVAVLAHRGHDQDDFKTDVAAGSERSVDDELASKEVLLGGNT